MTREEASFILANIDRRVCDDELNDALDMAIKALEQEPCDDTISRQAVIDAMRKNHRSGGRDIDGDYIEGDYRESLYNDIISYTTRYTTAENRAVDNQGW